MESSEERKATGTLSYATVDPDEELAPGTRLAWWCIFFPAPLLLLVIITGSVVPALLIPLTVLAVYPLTMVGLRAEGVGRRNRESAIAARWVATFELGFVLLVALALPQLGAAREGANRVKCASNLRQIGQGLMLYYNDHGQYPPTLDLLISQTDLNPEVFCCPSGNTDPATGPTTQQAAQAFASNPAHCDFVYLGATVSATRPASWVVAYEKNLHPKRDGVKARGMNFMFNDGHVEFFEEPQASKMVAELGAGQNPPPSAAASPMK